MAKKNFYPDEYKKRPHRSNLFHIEDSALFSRLCCSLCKEIMVEPIQTKCGCRFCFDCIETYVIEGARKCPNCDSCTVERRGWINDKAVEKEIMLLHVSCINEGCVNVFIFRDIWEHLRLCDYKCEVCKECHESYPRISKILHESKECPVATVVCLDCGEQMSRRYYSLVHRDYKSSDVCSQWNAPCPFNCTEDGPVNVRLHTLVCTTQPINCPMTVYGCQTVVPRAAIEAHISENIGPHLLLMMGEVSTLMADQERLMCESRQREEFLEAQIQQLNTTNENNMAEIRRLAEAVENIDTRWMGDSLVCKNGTVRWTITNIRAKIQSARSGEVDQIVSEPFYVERPGYKMALKLYPNGDGGARGEFASVFFSLYQGDYDDLLRWPFKSRVTLILVSHDASTPDLVVRMLPDNNYACYGRPLTEHNVAVGQPRFVRITEVMENDKYINNDAVVLTMSLLPC